MERTVRAVVQARMRSSRLPGKIMARLAGEPILAHVVRRLQSARLPAHAHFDVLVATTVSPADDVTEELCCQIGAHCFRGSEEDVLARYVAATADLADDDTVLRATADNPLYCPRRTARIVSEHLRRRADYTCISNLSYVVPEVMRAGALRTMAWRAAGPDCREHVTPCFRGVARGFRVVQLPPTWQGLRPEIRLTVDTPDQLARMAAIFLRLQRYGPLFSLEMAYQVCEEVVAAECH